MKQLLKEKREKLGTDWEEYKSFLDGLPAADKRTAEQTEELEKRDSALNEFEAEIDRLERNITADARAADRAAKYSEPELIPHLPPVAGGDGHESRHDVQAAIYKQYLTGGMGAVSKKDLSAYLNTFKASMVAGQDAPGGFLVIPEKMASGILQEADDMVFMRGLGTGHTITDAASLGIVSLDDDIDDYEWAAELSAGTLDDGLTFKKRAMTPHPLAKRVKISETLIRKSSYPVMSLVGSRLAYKLGITQEKNYLTGDGHNKPLGVFIASADGVPTTRDEAGNNTTTALTADTLVTVQGTLKEGYQTNARWLFHRDAITMLRKLKTTDLQYIWQPGLAENVPPRILGKPYVVSEYAPNTFTAGLYVGMYADFSYYWYVDALNMRMQVLRELYAETNQIGYIVRYEGDGQPVMSEAFTRIKLAAT